VKVGPKKEKTIEARRKQVAELFFKGITGQKEIAERLHVNQATVSRDLKILQEQWKCEAAENFSEAKANELKRLEHLEDISWQAFEESGRRKVVDKDGNEKIIENAGDSRFLNSIHKCIETRIKLLGLQSPTEITLEEKGSLSLQIRHIDLTDRIAAIEQDIKDENHREQMRSDQEEIERKENAPPPTGYVKLPKYQNRTPAGD